jgi:hypothetical protein
MEVGERVAVKPFKFNLITQRFWVKPGTSLYISKIEGRKCLVHCGYGPPFWKYISYLEKYTKPK